MPNVWKINKEKKEISKHMQQKHNDILVPTQRYKDSRHHLQHPTFPNYVIGVSNCAQKFTGYNYLDVHSPLDQVPNSCALGKY